MADSIQVQSLVNKIDVDDLAAFTALFMYQGFSPEMVFAHFAKILKEKGIENEEFQTDVKTLLVMGVIMGNYNSNNSSKISDEGKVKGDTLMAKYELKMGGIGKDRKKVNLPRIMAAFPIITTKISLGCPPRNYGGAFGADGLSAVMKTSVFPSLIPSTLPKSITSALLVAANAYATEQTMAISKQKDVKATYAAQLKFTEISYHSSVPSVKDRKSYIKTVEISHGALSTVISTASEILGAKVPMPTKDDMSKANLKMVD